MPSDVTGWELADNLAERRRLSQPPKGWTDSPLCADAGTRPVCVAIRLVPRAVGCRHDRRHVDLRRPSGKVSGALPLL